jgi:hypothetical protein
MGSAQKFKNRRKVKCHKKTLLAGVASRVHENVMRSTSVRKVPAHQLIGALALHIWASKANDPISAKYTGTTQPEGRLRLCEYVPV